MKIGTRLNRDFYIKMRINGVTHQTIISSIFPPERKESFCNDVTGLEEVDYTKKVDVDVLIETTSEPNPKKNTKKK